MRVIVKVIWHFMTIKDQNKNSAKEIKFSRTY